MRKREKGGAWTEENKIHVSTLQNHCNSSTHHYALSVLIRGITTDTAEEKGQLDWSQGDH